MDELEVTPDEIADGLMATLMGCCADDLRDTTFSFYGWVSEMPHAE